MFRVEIYAYGSSSFLAKLDPNEQPFVLILNGDIELKEVFTDEDIWKVKGASLFNKRLRWYG